MQTALDIWTEELPAPTPTEDWSWDPTQPVTGTNKFYVRVAEEFARRGFDVQVLRDSDKPLDHNGVKYRARIFARQDVDHLDCNGINPTPTSRARFHWNSQFGRYDFLNLGYDRVFILSDYHHSTIAHAMPKSGLGAGRVSVLPLGTDMPVTDRPDLLSRPKVCCFTSSPDRGTGLLRQIWSVVEKETGYTLLTTPYGPSASEESIQAVYDQSRFWLHPATGIELFCVSAIEAQARGCIPFYVPHMALPETCRYGIQTDVWKFQSDLIRTLNEFEATPSKYYDWEKVRSARLHHNPIPAWSAVVDRILG